MGIVTLNKHAEVRFIEKRSEFIGNAASVQSDEEAIAFVNEIRKKYPDARHNVYAYTVAENNITRYSDDGEPKGTAGIPVLEVIKKNSITNCAVVVTRYFGGILLGAGGLARAYTKSAADAVEAAEIVTYKDVVKFTVTCSFSDSEKVRYELSKTDVITEGIDYGDGVIYRLAAEDELYARVEKILTEATAARVRIEKQGMGLAKCK